MKKAQTAIEYLLAIVLAVVLCYCINFAWNKLAVIISATGGVRDQNGIINIPPMGF